MKRPVNRRPAAPARAAADVRAAGAICWRLRPGLPASTPLGPATMELLMVRSARWGNWTWPKGKVRRGEPAGVAAVREVAEETGVRPRLGLPLPSLRYVIGDGRLKQVDLWVGRTEPEGSRTGRPTATGEEIAELAWVPVDDALGRLEWPTEAGPATHLLTLARLGRLHTTSLLVVRHAKAVRRRHWDGPEAARPLSADGVEQAAELVDLLGCWGPATVISSPWTRCTATVAPYLAKHHREPVLTGALSQSAVGDDAQGVGRLVRQLVDDGADAALCTYRPVLDRVVPALREVASRRARPGLPRRDPWLRTAEVLVAHLRPGGGEVIAVERHRPIRYGLGLPA